MWQINGYLGVFQRGEMGLDMKALSTAPTISSTAIWKLRSKLGHLPVKQLKSEQAERWMSLAPLTGKSNEIGKELSEKFNKKFNETENCLKLNKTKAKKST